MILVPISDPTTSLKIMAQLSRLLMKTGVRDKVMMMETPNGLRDVFADHNPQIDKPIIARDIMRPPRNYVQKDTSVPTCSHMMSVGRLQAVPVLDDERNITIGDIMGKTARTVPKDYTIMEIVFDLAIKSYVKLYVVDDEGC